MQKNTELGKPASRTFVRKMFFSVIYVMMLTAIVAALVVLTQGICIQKFMGEDGDVATGAEGIAMPVFAFGTFFCYTFGFGLQIVASRYINSSKRNEIAYYFTANMILSLCAVLVFLIIGLFASEPIAKLLGAGSGTSGNPELELKYCAQSIEGYFIGFLFQCLFRSFHPSIYLDNAKKYAYIATAAMVVTTIGSFLLVGYFAPMETKMFWFGFLTTFSYSGGIIVFIIYFIVRNKNALFKFKFKGLKNYHFGHLFKFGTPTGLRKLSFALYILVLNFIIMAVDPTHYATEASGCQMHYQTLLVIVSSGIYYSCSTLSSYFTSLKDRQYFDDLLRFLTIVCFGFMPLISLLFIGVAEPLVAFYGTQNDIVYWSAVSSIRWYAAALPFITFGGVWLSVYQGANNNKWMYASIIWQDFFPLVFVAAFGFLGNLGGEELGRYMLWVGEFFGPIAVLIVHFFLGWIINKGKPFSADAIFFLEKKKLYPNNQVLRLNVCSKKDWWYLKRKINPFARFVKINDKKLEKVYKFINDVNDRVTKAKDPNKKYVADIRITKQNGKVIVNWTDSIKAKKIDKKSTYYIAVDSLKSLYPKILFSDTFNVNEFTLNI